MECPSCGRSIPDDASLCPYCGAQIHHVSQPKKRKVPVWVMGIGVILMCACVALIIAALGASDMPAGETSSAIARTGTPASSDPTFTPTPRATATPVPPSLTPSPTLSPTPAMLTVREIEYEKAELTDLQWEDYCRQMRGEPIRFSGEVIEVYEDGRIQIDDGNKLGTVVVLESVSHETALKIDLDDWLDGAGTVRELSTFLGIRVEIDVIDLQIR